MELHFRAKRKSDGAWVYAGTVINIRQDGKHIALMPDAYERSGCHLVSKDGIVTDIRNTRFYEVDVESVSVGSGIIVNDGKRIYEGDFICTRMGAADAPGIHGIVRYDRTKGTFFSTDLCGRVLGRLYGWNYITVEGNTWDNPELFERVASADADDE